MKNLIQLLAKLRCLGLWPVWGITFLKTPIYIYKTLTLLHGIGFGVTEGHNKWSSVNTTKNNIYMGLVDSYIGLMHDSGMYSTLCIQFAASKTKTKSSGFDKNYKWDETIPTESFELGWKYTFSNGFKLNPYGQLILEQLSKHHFDLKDDNDTAILDDSSITTTVLGIAAEYDLPLSIPVNLQDSIDWIQGISGDFAAKSKILNKKFKDKNDTSTIRTTLNFNLQPNENLSVHLNLFIDLGNNKGIGGQIGATYKI